MCYYYVTTVGFHNFNLRIYIYLSIYIYIYTYTYTYIYIYIHYYYYHCYYYHYHDYHYGRFPSFQSSNFQFESFKSEQIDCGCLFDTMSDFNVPGSRPKRNEISEIDRKSFPTKSPWGKLSGRCPVKLYGHENSHPLELRVCLSQTLWNPNS